LKQTSHVCGDCDNDHSFDDLCDFLYDPERQVHSALTATVLPTDINGSPEVPAHTDNSKLPGHELENYSVHVRSSTVLHPPRLRVISFDKIRDIRIFQQDSLTTEFKDYSQVCDHIARYKASLRPVTYLMANVASLDHSLKEVFYQSLFTSPHANKLALIEEEDDFSY